MRMYKHVLSNTGRNGKNVKENIFVDSKKNEKQMLQNKLNCITFNLYSSACKKKVHLVVYEPFSRVFACSRRSEFRPARISGSNV